MRSSGKGKATRIGGLLAATAAAAVLQGCKDEIAVAEPPAPVRVAEVVLSPEIETLRYAGVIRPRFESDLGFRVAGKIVERAVDIGDRVSPGDLIARLDATDYALRLEAQKAELAAARSSRDQAVAAEQRFKTLKDQGHVAEAALDIRKASADEARARVDRAERGLEIESHQVAYAELRADKAGVVSAMLAEAGQVVAAGQTVARIARLDALEAVVAIPEQKLGDVKGANASVELWANGARRYPARLREISPEADRATRTFEARFTIVAPDADVQLGRTATVTLQRGGGPPFAALPLSAVMNDSKGPMVWVVGADGATLERRAVQVAAFEHERALIAGGLKAGERVVTLGVHKLDAARPVRIVETHQANKSVAEIR